MSLWGDIVGWFSGEDAFNWLKSAGADIASGLEGGIVAIFKDFWLVVKPFLFIIVGVIIMGVATGWFFTGRIASPAMIAAALSAA